MLKNIKNKISWTNIYLVLFFLYSLRICLVQDEILWAWGIVGIIYFVIKQKKLLWGFQGIILCIITPLYALVYKYYFTETRGYTWTNVIYMIFLPVFMYVLCRQFAWKRKSETLESVIWCVAGSSFLYSLLNHWMYIKEGFLPDGRIWREFWSGNPIYATEASFWAVFITALTGYGLSCLLHKEWKKGIAALTGVLIGNLINIQVGNRMVFMTTFVAMVIALGMFFIINRKNRKALRNALCMMVVIFLVVIVLCYLNIDKIQQSSYYTAIISRDGGIFHNVRFAMIKETLQQLPDNLWGGGHIYPAGFAAVHNYWLQAANDTGIITLILWIIYTVIAIVDAVKLVFSKNISSRVKYMVIPMISAVAAYMMMEQAGAGRCDYVNFYVMLSAFMHQMVSNENNCKIEKIHEKQ